MVYCTQCGAKNEEGARYCSKCGDSLEISREKNLENRMGEWGEAFGRRAEEWGEDFGKRMEEECFGLPYGGVIVGIIFGVLIIIVGLGLLFDWTINIGGYIVIIIGVLILSGAIYRLNRRR